VQNGLLQTLDTNGVLIDALQFPAVSDITSGFNNAIHVTSFFFDTVDLDPTVGVFTAMAMPMRADAFVLKLQYCRSTTGTDVQTACNSYTWINGSTYTSSNNSAMFTLTNAAGCDSI